MEPVCTPTLVVLDESASRTVARIRQVNALLAAHSLSCQVFMLPRPMFDPEWVKAAPPISPALLYGSSTIDPYKYVMGWDFGRDETAGPRFPAKGNTRERRSRRFRRARRSWFHRRTQ